MRSALLASLIAFVPAAALADVTPAAPAAAVEAVAPAPSDSPGMSDDPNADRAFLLSTALTQPKGSLSFNDYELVMLGLTYGVTDRLQVSAMVLAPITKDMPIFFVGSTKLRILDKGALHLALQGGVTYLDFHEDSFSSDKATALSGGVIGTVCVDVECRSVVNGSVTAIKPFASGTSGGDVALIYGASVAGRVSQYVKLMVELVSGSAFEDGDFHSGDGALLTYGARFHGEHFAADVGFIRPVGDNSSSDLLLGIPFLNFTYRN